MVSTVCLYGKLMICFVLLCALIHYSQSQPLFDGYIDDNDDQAQIYYPALTDYLTGSNQFLNLNLPENLYNYRQPSKPYNSDHVQLTKRIIMLPRVGRRSNIRT